MAREFGLLIEATDTLMVNLKLVERNGLSDVQAPSASTMGTWSDVTPFHVGYYFYNLRMDGMVEEDGTWFSSSPSFGSAYNVRMDDLDGMYATLRRITKGLEKDAAIEPGDRLVSIARSLKLDFVATKRPDQSNGKYWFWSIAEGRNRYRELIDERKKAAVAKAAQSAATATTSATNAA
jgi:hypothetical protein